MSYYHDFRTAPPGKHVVKVCQAEACQAMGTNDLATQVQARLGIDWHGTTPDGKVTLEPVYCLGLCANGPAAMVGDRIIARADADAIEAAVSEAKS